jgi:hypothetical protein
MSRIQIPLAPERVRTVQTAQGLSMDSAAMFLTRPPGMNEEDHWLHVYVMLSRVCTLAQILIYGLPARKTFEMGPPAWTRTGLADLNARSTVDRLRAKAAMANLGWVVAEAAVASAAPLAVLVSNVISEVRVDSSVVGTLAPLVPRRVRSCLDDEETAPSFSLCFWEGYQASEM